MPVSALTAEVMGAPTLRRRRRMKSQAGFAIRQRGVVDQRVRALDVRRRIGDDVSIDGERHDERRRRSNPSRPVGARWSRPEPAGSLGVKITAMYSPALASSAVMLALRAERLESTSVHVVGAFPAPTPKA